MASTAQAPGGNAGQAQGHGNPAIRIAGAPAGVPTSADFAVADLPIPDPGPGEVLFRSHYMSIDPAMRRKLPSPVDAPKPLGGQLSVGDIMTAGQYPVVDAIFAGHVGEVVESRDPAFRPGDLVRGGSHWQLFQLAPGRNLLKLDCPQAELIDELGLLGQPAFVAWCGMRHVANLRPGETFVVSAAGGAIGMMAGQIAKIAGARVIGIASGKKAHYVVDELGFDACVDRHAEAIDAGIDRLCPEGIDVFFDNVGGAAQAICYDRLRDFGRLVVCGMASEYNAPESEVGPPLRPLLRKRLTIGGFVVYDHAQDYPRFREEVMSWRDAGLLRYRYDVRRGLHNAPAALAALLQGRNAGKVVIDMAAGV